MANLSGAVTKTMNFVFADIETSTNEMKKRIDSLRANVGKIASIALDEIETNENIRKSIDTKSGSFLRLVESIKKYGVLENVVVELKVNKKENDYKLVCIAGHRRILAAKMTKSITKIPCLLQLYANNGDNVGAALAENLNREDLHCLDVADGYKELINAGWTEEDLVKHFCRDIRTIKHYLKMAAWPDEIKESIRKNPEVLSTRVIMRNLAYKRYDTTLELKSAIKDILVAKPKVSTKSTQPPPVSVAATRKNPHDKQAMKTALNNYLAKQKLLSTVIKNEIRKAFTELHLI